MATSDNAPSDMIEIEIDNFVSPNAANDVPNDDFVALEIDAAPVATVPEATTPTVETTTEHATLASALTAMVAPVTGDTSGSLTSGTMAYVGFTSADGYVTALANGVKQATADSYKATLRHSYGFTTEQIDALTVTIIPESTGLANGDATATVVTHDGPNVFEARRLARGLTENARIAPTAVHAPAATAPAPGGHEDILPDFDGSIVVESITERLHGLSLHYGPCQIPRHTIARDVVIDLLTNAGFADCIPAIRTGNAQLRKVMNSLNSAMARTAREDDLRLKTWNVTKKDCDRMVAQGHTEMAWPANLDSRWCVGLLDAGTELGSMGSKELVVSLVEVTDENGGTALEVQFSGGTERMRRAVTERFDALYGTSALNVTDLIQWYVATLQTKFNAIRQGFKLLIPGTEHNQDNMARAERFMQVLQGSNVYGPSPIMGRRLDCDKVTSRQGATWESFCLNVGAGMVEDVRALGQDFAMALKLSQDRARANVPDGASEADIELAVRRAVIGSDRENSAARGLLARLTALAARARDSVSLIGRTHAKAAIDACEALRAEWVGKCHADSTSSMMAQIELD